MILNFVRKHPAWTIVIAVILCFCIVQLDRELHQSYESMTRQHNAHWYLQGNVGLGTGIASWDTPEEWEEGRDDLARILGFRNREMYISSWNYYGRLYFIDRRSHEFLEIMQGIIDMPWDDPNREAMVEEYLSLEYNCFIGGKPYDLLWEPKGVWFESDTSKLMDLLGITKYD